MTAALVAAIERAVGRGVTALQQVTGGDINSAYRVGLSDGARVFVKTCAGAPPGAYQAEADGLDWLRRAGALALPEVLAATDELLVLSWIESAARARDFDEQLGRGLALLHRSGAASFGHARDNFLANLPQANGELPSWSEFYRARRLEPLLARALARGVVDARERSAFEQLYLRLPALLGEPEPPARLHGDLWSGNVHVDERGRPVLIDPAVYGGHREIDLAMLQLFGAPSARFFAAYDEVYPRAPGAHERVALHQLYPLLVHVSLFGRGYLAQLRSALGEYV